MKKILIAEDDQFLVNAYQVKLTKAGFEVKIARDGQEAINTLSTFIPDLILLDIIMPVKDGFGTLKELKENPLWSKIPVIVASNLGQKEDLEKSKKLGAVDFIIKSDLSLENLITKINALLANGPQAASQASASSVPVPVVPTTTTTPVSSVQSAQTSLNPSSPTVQTAIPSSASTDPITTS